MLIDSYVAAAKLFFLAIPQFANYLHLLPWILFKNKVTKHSFSTLNKSLRPSQIPIKQCLSLLLDEIHLKLYFDFKGGNIVGQAHNSSEPAKSAFVFMITSLFSSYKDVVYIFPANKMKSDILHKLISKTIVGLETIGFRVISVITDNNSINSKAMSFFSSPPKKSIVHQHPSD